MSVESDAGGLGRAPGFPAPSEYNPLIACSKPRARVQSRAPCRSGAISEQAMKEHAVLIAGGGPTGLMLAGELRLAGVDVAIVERRPNQELAGSRAGGLHARSLEVLDQRGIVERFLAIGQKHPALHFHLMPLDISDLPTRHNYVLGLFQNHIERLLAEWVEELDATI